MLLLLRAEPIRSIRPCVLSCACLRKTREVKNVVRIGKRLADAQAHAILSCRIGGDVSLDIKRLTDLSPNCILEQVF